MVAIITAFKFLSALLGLGITAYGIRTASIKFKTWSKRKRIAENEYAEIFVSQYNEIELKEYLSGYVEPYCSISDPTNRDGVEYLADLREKLFEYLDRSIANSARFYHILLADTGMGKTAFCLNYYAHAKKKFDDQNIALVSLARSDALEKIRRARNKTGTILIADALDEDPSITDDPRARLDEILLAAADFRAVIITCRSQFFLNDDLIPRETPLPKIVGRGLNQAPVNSLARMFILPFGEKEIRTYVSKHFPLFAIWKRPQRLRALDLVRRIPDLAHRPMLLEKLPEIAISAGNSHEIYDLYDALVLGWLEREEHWISGEDLMAVSKELAHYIYAGISHNQARITPDQINFVAKTQLGVRPEWSKLTARSLLNRDVIGRYKFAHKSILEFLLVRMVCDGDNRPLALPWTPFMRELFVSWGHTEKGKLNLVRARNVLESQEGRKNVTPLYDMAQVRPVIGKPDFKRCAERRFAENGDRLAPPTWRSSSFEIIDKGTFVSIIDNELNLRWSYYRDDSDVRPVNLKELLDYSGRPDRRLPSYEQLLSLVEGLEYTSPKILPLRRLILLGDRPSTQEHLLAEINPSSHVRTGVSVVDKARSIAGTNKRVSAYVTGIRHAANYATALKPIQLWLSDSVPN